MTMGSKQNEGKHGQNRNCKQEKENGLKSICEAQDQSPIKLGFPLFQAQSYLGSQIAPKPNPNWAPEESKAQLKWAPATSKDGSDYDPPSPVRNS
jgi:hypothetical protein